MSLVLRGSDEKLSVVSKCATLAALSNNEAVLAWGKRQQRRLDFRKGIGAVDQDQAMAIADELLKGICRQADLILIGDTADAWEIKFSVPPMHLYEERLIINKHTGTFTYSRSR
jgi:hypothetical protein